MKYEVRGSRPTCRPKEIWIEVVENDCQALKLNKEEMLWNVLDGGS